MHHERPNAYTLPHAAAHQCDRGTLRRHGDAASSTRVRAATATVAAVAAATGPVPVVEQPEAPLAVGEMGALPPE